MIQTNILTKVQLIQDCINNVKAANTAEERQKLFNEVIKNKMELRREFLKSPQKLNNLKAKALNTICAMECTALEMNQEIRNEINALEVKAPSEIIEIYNNAYPNALNTLVELYQARGYQNNVEQLKTVLRYLVDYVVLGGSNLHTKVWISVVSRLTRNNENVEEFGDLPLNNRVLKVAMKYGKHFHWYLAHSTVFSVATFGENNTKRIDFHKGAKILVTEIMGDLDYLASPTLTPVSTEISMPHCSRYNTRITLGNATRISRGGSFNIYLANALNSTQYKSVEITAKYFQNDLNVRLGLVNEISGIKAKQNYMQAYDTCIKASQILKEFYFDWKYDSRNRIYSVGYPFNPQGKSFDKALITLTDTYSEINANFKPSQKELQVFEPEEYKLIHLANLLGLDKLNYTDRIAKAKEVIKLFPSVESFDAITKEELEKEPKKQEIVQALKAEETTPEFRVVLQDLTEGTDNTLVGFDASSSGSQIYAIGTGDEGMLKAVGLSEEALKEDFRPDAYTYIYQDFLKAHPELAEANITRTKIKQVIMTMLYGSTKQALDILGNTAGTQFLNFFKTKYPKAGKYLNLLTTFHHSPKLGNHKESMYRWTLPGGIVATSVPRDTVKFLDGYIQADTRFCKDVALAANTIHSIDALILSEIVLRANYDKVKVAEAKKVIQEFMQRDPKGKVALDEQESNFVTIHLAYKLVDDPKAYEDFYLTQEFGNRLLDMLNQCEEYEPFHISPVHDCFYAKACNITIVRTLYSTLMVELYKSDLLTRIVTSLNSTAVEPEEGFVVKETKDESLESIISKSNYLIC